MTTLNAKFLDWSIQKAIKDRVQIESILQCQIEGETFHVAPPIPKFIKNKTRPELTAGMWNFIRQLRP